MLGFTARFGSSKGMVAVPNLSGRTFDQALSDIQASGLKFKNGTIRITNNQALDKDRKSVV
jgi:beta-lactam-binding protein with PASTA domain